MRRLLAFAFVLLALPAVAHAQYEDETAVGDTTTTTPEPSETSSSPDVGSSGVTRMGVGVESMAGVFSGPAFVYDAGEWHIDAILGWSVVKDAPDTFRLGGRFWYVLKSSAQADLSLGGGLAFGRTGAAAPMADATNAFYLEAGAKIRVFLVRQVALTGSFGAALGLVGDEGNDTFALRGDALGSFGLIYFFR